MPLSCFRPFVYGPGVTFKSGKLIPVLLCLTVSGLMVLLQSLTSRNEDFLFVRRLEWMTFDWRVRAATNQPSACAPNLGFVFINDETIRRVQSGQFGYSHGLYWPRHVYGRIVKELATQQAEAIAFDVLFPDVRKDHPLAELPDGTTIPSDKFFTDEVRRAGNVILGSLQGTVPPPEFRRSAAELGDISAVRDSDGILRRARAFEDYVIWHNAILEADSVFDGFSYNTNEVVFPGPGNERTRIPIAPDGTFDLATLMELGQSRKLADGVVRTSKAFVRQRVWDLGLASAARYLNLDLHKAVVEPGKHILLRGGPDVERVIPIDHEGRFYIDWSLTSHDRRIRQESAHSLLLHQRLREIGQTNEIASIWRDKIAVIGSIASGNDLADYGATPLEKGTYLTSRFWNTANSLIIDRFIRQPDFATELYIILSLGIITGILTWNLRAVSSAIGVVVIAGVYVASSLYLYSEVRYWLPLVMPTATLFATHSALISYRAVFEQREQRRVRNIFAKLVSPNVVTELLKAEKLSLEGARREVTVFFSDVRGFTEMTDESHALAEEFVRAHQLSPADAEAYFDQQAGEVLQTVNLYLGAIAETVKKHDGTLDKYIGDCVMAFWNAPTPVPKHAHSCVRAAIEAQRAIEQLNRERAIENERRERGNPERVKAGLPPLRPLKLLSMGSGINTGIVTVGLMGSKRDAVNFTVFGREVNLASRLEGLSGRGRILIGESCFAALQKDDPELAATCKELEPATVKGFRTPVKIYEVPWREGGGATEYIRSITPVTSLDLSP